MFSLGSRRLAAVVLAPVLLLLAACEVDVGPGEEAQELPSATLDVDDQEGWVQVPAGEWIVRQNAGFSVATPGEWHVPPEEYRFNRAALHVEFPFTGQPFAPPRLLGFIERGAVGDVETRESILRAILPSQLPPDATLGDTQEVDIEGAERALEFEVTYTTENERSYLDTTLRGTKFRQVELLIETEGTPKLGFRYSAPERDFDADQWQRIRDSIVVRPEELGNAPEPGGDSESG